MALGYMSAVIDQSGFLWTAGYGGYGQLGNGISGNVSIFRKVNEKRWKQVSIGETHILGIQEDGTLWAWGQNSYGQLGNNTTANEVFPVKIGEEKWKFIAAGHHFSAGIKEDGTLWGWGRNAYGELNKNVSGSFLIPHLISDRKFKKVCGTGGFFMLALEEDGTLWGSGANNYGQLGMVVSSGINLLQKLSDDKIIDVSAGALTADYSFSMIIKEDGTLWSTGYNAYGQLGLNHKTQVTKFTKVSDKKFSKVSCGYNFAMVIDEEGVLWSVGYNGYGQLGIGNTVNKEVLQEVMIGGKVKEVTSLHTSVTAIREDGSLYAWGRNNYGEIGDLTGTARSYPRKINIDTFYPKVKSIIAVMENSTILEDEDGNLWGAGSNTLGQLGDGSLTNRLNPVNLGKNIYLKIKNSSNSVVAMKEDGSIWGWGLNNYGQLGTGDVVNKLTPTLISAEKFIDFDISDTHMVALKEDGTLWGSGYSGYGQIVGKVNSNILRKMSDDKFIEVKVGGDNSTTFTIAKKEDGTLWGCGYNGYYHFGRATIGANTVVELTQIKIPDVTNEFENFYVFNNQFIILETKDEDYYSCGNYSAGSNLLSVAVQNFEKIKVDFEGKKIKEMFSSDNHSILLMDDNSMYAIGTNGYGQLGTGTSVTLSELTYIMPGIKSIFNRKGQTHIIKEDGTYIRFGSNLEGGLFYNSTMYYMTSIEGEGIQFPLIPANKTTEDLREYAINKKQFATIKSNLPYKMKRMECEDSTPEKTFVKYAFSSDNVTWEVFKEGTWQKTSDSDSDNWMNRSDVEALTEADIEKFNYKTFYVRLVFWTEDRKTSPSFYGMSIVADIARTQPDVSNLALNYNLKQKTYPDVFIATEGENWQQINPNELNEIIQSQSPGFRLKLELSDSDQIEAMAMTWK